MSMMSMMTMKIQIQALVNGELEGKEDATSNRGQSKEGEDCQENLGHGDEVL